MQDCIFCKIVAGEIPSHKVYEDDSVLAFLDINPVNPGHTMVIPKEHCKDLLSTPPDIAGKLVVAAQHIAPAVMKAAGTNAFHLDINNGEGAGQAVFHAHFHIQPRSKDDGLTLWPGTSADQEELKKMADDIKKHL